MAKAKSVAKGVSSLFDDAFEKVGTATTRGARRQKQKKSNVFQRDAKTGQVRSVSRGERVKRGQKVTGGAAAATGAAAAGSAAMADKGGKKQSTKVGKMKRGDSVKRTETPKKAGATRGERKQKTSPRGVSVGRSKPKPTLNKQGAAAFAKALDEAGKRKAAKKAEAEAKAKAKAKAKAEAEKKKDKEKKTILGLEIKPSSRFAGRGGKRRRVAGRAMGGMMKSKMASKGGAKGGKRMPTGMKKGGMPMKTVNGMRVPAFAADGKGPNDLTKKMMGGGMMKSKGMAKGGAMKKKGYAMGGSVKKKGMAKGGAMKKKGYAMGGMTKKGMAKGGAMTKKGMAKGGSVRRNTKPRGVGAALRGFGKAMKK